MQPPKDFSNLFLDMNAFFASVEQQVQPELRGKPICVAPYTGGSGCCIAKSYEAKAYGVSTGHLVRDAKRLCPSIVVLESRPELYMSYHRKIAEVVESFSPFITKLSVDEFNIKLTGSDQNQLKAMQIARDLKQTIRDKVGDHMFCSVGIAPNAWLAKVAGELKKPDGLFLIKLEDLPDIYKKMELTDLPGINFAMEKRLKEKNINTPLDFFKASLTDLSLYFGHPGRVWYFRLRGYEVDSALSPTKSLGHQHVLAPKYRNTKSAREVLLKMAQKCAAGLRRKKMKARGVSVGISFLGHSYFRKNITTGLLSDSMSVSKIALDIFDSCKEARPPLKISVTMFNLVPENGYQISLFPEIQKSQDLSCAIDIINDRFGNEVIRPASTIDVKDSAPNRIPFGSPERLDF